MFVTLDETIDYPLLYTKNGDEFGYYVKKALELEPGQVLIDGACGQIRTLFRPGSGRGVSIHLVQRNEGKL